ncbi:hypothetical protein [Microbacterium rhizosphaerae]|uniref:Tannase/feruloyl esterase family alpha/beta hydrolase n=1 Tax=Microbacterium rhizosphaerae TaxID=1678237 RepID=A0ABZ0SJ14_9MICO|nr:hypothetical protein [Microbacterium rhizosphaerae]WPR89366.1 hypothetical protein SM116_16635 [Microbacterium rhizosphaerae]
MPDDENISQGQVGEEDKISFSIASGAYFVETNGGGSVAKGEFPPSPLISAYGANAAVAAYSRVVAQEVYGPHRAYGYLFGGSGGGFRTMGAAENTEGVWDGFVPYVIGSPMALPNVFSVRMHAQRILRDKLDDIADAMDVGGSGDPYATLTEEEAAAFREVTAMGFPTRAWFGHRGFGAHGYPAVRGPMTMVDPSYFEDFWKEPGYLGSDPESSVHRDRVVHTTSVTETLSTAELAELNLAELPHLQRQTSSGGGVDESFKQDSGGKRNVAAVRLAAAAPADTQSADLIIVSGPAEGTVVQLRLVKSDLAVLDIGNDPRVFDLLDAGVAVKIDNSTALAAQTYHRHQVPDDRTFAVWDQYRDNTGNPRFPQRSVVIGPLITQSASGQPQTGRFEGKMIVCASLLDREAFPWQASWYADRVREHLGPQTDDRFRLWFTDNAVHGDIADEGQPTRIVSYLGTLQAALRALSGWVEGGIDPARSTEHRVVDGQVLVLGSDQPGGVQPVALLTADGTEHAHPAVGEAVEIVLEATAQIGGLVSVKWDLDGDGVYESIDRLTGESIVRILRTARFDTPGVRFLTARITAQPDSDAATPFARLSNLARVRISVD